MNDRDVDDCGGFDGVPCRFCGRECGLTCEVGEAALHYQEGFDAGSQQWSYLTLSYNGKLWVLEAQEGE